MGTLKVLIPVGLAIAAGALNYFAMTEKPTPLELAIANDDIRAGGEISDAQVGHMPVVADRELFRSAVPYGERGAALLQRRARRTIHKGEVIFFDDVQIESNRLKLAPDEVLMMVSLDSVRYVPSFLRVGSKVGFVISKDPPPSSPLGFPPIATVPAKDSGTAPAGSQPNAAARILGPFTVFSYGEQTTPYEARGGRQPEESRLVGVAIKKDANNVLDERSQQLVQALNANARTGTGTSGGERITALVFYGEK